MAEHHPDAAPVDTATFALAGAQLVMARQYGFASWARLKRHLEEVARLTRSPDSVDAQVDRDDEFLRLACLTYGDDGPDRWAAADDWSRSIRASARHRPGPRRREPMSRPWRACCRPIVAVAVEAGGPFGWPPLLYVTYARHDRAIDEASVLATVDRLLDAGADPNAGYLWHGLPTPMTALTGLFGGGERGEALQPRHPHWHLLARRLLEAGADPNDGQALYNLMFQPNDDHLMLLFEYGLGTGDGGPWRARLGEAVDSPPELLRSQLRWALTHGMHDRVRLLLEHEVEIRTPYADGRTAIEVAALSGYPALVADLEAAGAAPLHLGDVDEFIASALAGEAARVLQLRDAAPDVVRRAIAARPALIVHAAAAGRPEAVRLLADLGFDVNAKGRADVGTDEPWQTALHEAVAEHDADMVELLLSLGADPNVRDHRFDATPLGWARHLGAPGLEARLLPITGD